MRSAISRWKRSPLGFITTSCSGDFLRWRSCSTARRWLTPASGSGRSTSAWGVAGKGAEPLQLVLGLSIPVLIISHIVGVRLGQSLFDHEKLYPQELYAFWVARPARIWLVFLVLIIPWVHGCIGLHFWLRMEGFYK